ncbi:MAG: zinc ribbon domain-containing protein [Acetatifactor sp.]|nr:zinc ribbon domain-containing protein [Acetatifactor sp.]
MFCSNCGKEIPDGAKFCGFCGTPTEAAEPAKEEVKASEPVVETPAAPVAEAPAVPAAEAPAAPVAEAPAAPAAPVAPAPAPAYSPIPEEPKAKKGKGGKIIGIALAIVAVLAVAIGCTFIFAKDKVSNTIHKSFDKPKDYYSYVEKKNLTAFSENSGTEYVTKLLESMKTGNQNISETMKIRIGARGKDFTALAKTAGVDLSWLDSVGISFNGNFDDTKMKMDIAPILNDTKLATLVMLLDMKEGAIFGTIPELTDKYLGMTMGEEYDYDKIMGSMEQAFGMYEEMLKSYPSPEKLEEMFVKYYEIMMEQIEEMEKTKGKLEVDDISVECTVLTCELKSKDIQKIARAIIKEMKKDKDIEKMITGMFSSFEGLDESFSAEDMYEDFLKSLDEAEESIDSIEIDKLTMEIYVDKDGKIVGRTFSLKMNDVTGKLVLADIHTKDDKVGIEISGKVEGEGDFSVIVTGEEKKGKFNGEAKVKAVGKKILNVTIEDYDVDAAEKGNFSGTITLKLGSDVDFMELLEDAFGGLDDTPVYSLIANLDPAIRFSGEMTVDSHNITISLLDGGSEIVALIFEGAIKDGESFGMPSDYIAIASDGSYDEAALMDLLKNLKFEAITDNLKNANVPDEYMSMINQYIEMLKMQMR